MNRSAPIESPCVSVCMMNAEDERCYGCFRTLDEIANWASYTSAQRKGIMEELDQRRQQYDPYTD